MKNTSGFIIIQFLHERKMIQHIKYALQELFNFIIKAKNYVFDLQ